MKRRIRQMVQMGLDFILGFVVAAYGLLLFDVPYPFTEIFFLSMSFSSIKVVGNYMFGNYKQLWRYTSFRELQNIIFVSSIFASLFSFFIIFGLFQASLFFLVFDSFAYFVGATGIRSIRRFQYFIRLPNFSQKAESLRTLIIGAGSSAEALIDSITGDSTVGLSIIGLLDDDKNKIGAEIHGRPILDDTSKMEEIVTQQEIQMVIVAMPTADVTVRRNLVSRARKCGVQVKVIPSFTSLGRGNSSLYDTTITIGDLLDGKEFQTKYMSNSLKKDHDLVLITGGAGYIGLHLVDYFLSNNYRVRVLDNFTFGKDHLKHYENNPNLELLEGDIANIRDVVPVLKGVNTVIALAALVGDPACGVDAEETLNLNYEATKILIETANFYGVKRFVFASSCSVYGAADDVYLNENSPLNPVSLYAKTRIMSEEVILERCGNVEPVILRLSTVFGLSPRMRFDLVVNLVTVKAIVEGKFQIFGGDQWRPFVHCKDAAKAFYLAATAPSENVESPIFNVGSDEMNYNLKEVGKLVHSCVPNSEYELVESQEDARNYKVSFEKITQVLGFRPDYTLASGIEEMVDAVQKNTQLQNYKTDTFSNLQVIKSKFGSK
ncbi:MAG: NAD-dependent epimerase/dehydratase family protein [bacterium]|nr:NAD-dependent epimerase/dehydratase family protein [bacterium]